MTEPAKKAATRPEAVPAPAAEPKPSGPAVTAPTVRDIRRQRARRLGIRLALCVALPTLLSAVYFGFVATRQFESVGSFTIQSADNSGPASLEFLIATVPGSGAARDALLVQSYVESRDMVRMLVDEHGFTEHYAHGDVDYWSRLPADATFEDVFEYYQDHVDAEYDTQSGVVTIRVRAFDSETAKRLADAILASSEAMVNRMMDQARQDRIELAQSEVRRAEERLGAARQRVLELQGQRSEINPLASAEAVLSVRSALDTELATARAELNAMRATLQPGTPQLVAQQQRVAALSRQVQSQSRRLAANEGDDGLSADIAAFEPAVAEKEFAEAALESALKSMEMARIEASRQHRYLVTISRPSAPDEWTHPRVFIAILTVFVLSFALLGIGSLLLASVREHANL